MSADVENWTTSDVQCWLKEIGLGVHTFQFGVNEVKGSTLRNLKPDDLVSMGLNLIGHKYTFIDERDKLLARVRGGVIGRNRSNTVKPRARGGIIGISKSNTVKSLKTKTDYASDGANQDKKQKLVSPTVRPTSTFRQTNYFSKKRIKPIKQSTIMFSTKLRWSKKIYDTVTTKNAERKSGPIRGLNRDQLGWSSDKGWPVCMVCPKEFVAAEGSHLNISHITNHFATKSHWKRCTENHLAKIYGKSDSSESIHSHFAICAEREKTLLELAAFFLAQTPSISDHAFTNVQHLIGGAFGLLSPEIKELREALRSIQGVEIRKTANRLFSVYDVLSKVKWHRAWMADLIVANGMYLNQEDLDSIRSGYMCHISLDESTNSALESRLVIGSSWIDKSFKYRRAILCSYDVSGKQTGEVIFGLLISYLKSTRLLNKTATVATDGASSVCRFTGKEISLMARMSKAYPFIADFWCLCHQLNLAISDGVMIDSMKRSEQHYSTSIHVVQKMNLSRILDNVGISRGGSRIYMYNETTSCQFR